MSYDLYFCRKERNLVTREELASWASKYAGFNQVEKNQLWYSNEDTGVYFGFELGAAGEDGPGIPSGYFDAGVSFNLNYVRPTFFAHEAMPVVEDLASSLDLLLVSPQDSREQPYAPEAAALIENWKTNNQAACLALSQEQEGSGDTPTVLPPFMPEEDALRWWEYQFRRRELEKKFTEQYFVPMIFLLRRAGTLRVETAVTWTAGVPMLVPTADWAAVVRERKRTLRRPMQEAGCVRAERLMKDVGSYLDVIDAERGWRAIPKRSLSTVNELLESAVFEHPMAAFVRVQADGFQDVVGDLNAGRSRSENSNG